MFVVGEKHTTTAMIEVKTSKREMGYFKEGYGKMYLMR